MGTRILDKLGGAEFKVFEEKLDDNQQPIFADENKVADLSDTQLQFNIDADKNYYLVETKAPKNLSLLVSPLKLTSFTKDGKVFLSADNSFVSKIEVTDEGKLIVLTVNDIRTGKLPLTGGQGMAWY